MQNLQTFFTALQEKISTLEIKERERIQNEVLSLQEKGHSSTANSRIHYTERDIFFWKLSIKYKLFLSLSKFISENDIINDVRLVNGVKGLEITCKVIREGEEYDFITNVVEAGGYNIQCFHYRYITHTSLKPVTTNNLAKLFKLQEEKERLEFQFEEYKSRPLTVNNYTTKEWQEKSRQNNIESYQKRITQLQNKINNLNTNENIYR